MEFESTANLSIYRLNWNILLVYLMLLLYPHKNSSGEAYNLILSTHIPLFRGKG